MRYHAAFNWANQPPHSTTVTKQGGKPSLQCPRYGWVILSQTTLRQNVSELIDGWLYSVDHWLYTFIWVGHDLLFGSSINSLVTSVWGNQAICSIGFYCWKVKHCVADKIPGFFGYLCATTANSQCIINFINCIIFIINVTHSAVSSLSISTSFNEGIANSVQLINWITSKSKQRQ